MKAVCMEVYMTFQASRKTTERTFKLLLSFMSNLVTLHAVPTRCRVFAVRAFKSKTFWLLTMEAVGMSAHVIFQARRKIAVIAFELLFSFMPNSMALHTIPAMRGIFTIGAFKPDIFLFVSISIRSLVVPRRFNRLFWFALRTSKSTGNLVKIKYI